MEIIGVICEYNPFHHGHKYHLNKIKELYPDSLVILVLNGYFLERGEISILTKEDKVKIALDNQVDLVVELPFVFGSESADTFAYGAMKILNYLKVDRIVFGSELNDINYLYEIANKQLGNDYQKNLISNLKKGFNYPTALNKALNSKIDNPNDLLGVSYIKCILANNYSIKATCIKRTSDYHDLCSNNTIISASNIRNKIKNKKSVKKYTDYYDNFKIVNEKLLFDLLKAKALTDHNLSQYLTVDEGIENRLVKVISKVNSFDDLVNSLKTKRYTINRIKRMLIHILVGFTKEDRKKISIDYIKVLGFNDKGQDYLKRIDKKVLIQRKIDNNIITQKYELIVSSLYDMLTGSNTLQYELNNKPIKKINID